MTLSQQRRNGARQIESEADGDPHTENHRVQWRGHAFGVGAKFDLHVANGDGRGGKLAHAHVDRDVDGKRAAPTPVGETAASGRRVDGGRTIPDQRPKVEGPAQARARAGKVEREATPYRPAPHAVAHLSDLDGICPGSGSPSRAARAAGPDARARR